MNIAIIGNDTAFKEATSKLGGTHEYIHFEVFNPELKSQKFDVVFDFNSERTQDVLLYSKGETPVFINTVFSTLAEYKMESNVLIFGFCGLPTFFNRSLIEVVSSKENKTKLESSMTALGLNFTIVKDHVGMVTPRIVCMIINEAYETLNQGVASREDIDLSMKLGTNYPFGPFEWSEKIGLENVKRLLINLGQTPNF